MGMQNFYSQLSSTNVIYQFRKNDLKFGHGAPLTSMLITLKKN